MKHINHKTGLYILLIFSMIFWGTSYVFTKIVLPCTNPITLIFTRLIISSAMLWLIIGLFKRKEKIAKSDWKYIIALSFFEPFLYFIGETYALERVSPVIVSPVIATIPVFTALVMTTFYHVKLSKLNMVGIFFSFFGVVFMISNKNMQIDVDGYGLLLLLLAVMSSVGYGLMITKLSGKINAMLLIALQNTIGIFLFLPLWLFWGEPITYSHLLTTPWINLSPTIVFWLCVLILAIFSSSLAFMFYSMAVAKIGISRAAVFTNLIPIFTAITAYFLTGEILSPIKMTGILIIITGVVLTQSEKAGNKKHTSTL